ncbi:MAG TPA: low temperature requirement protein A, partial [Candidatus Obscuribacterales bacterium]
MPDARKSLWWGPPRILADQPGERKISWLELFYDLVYVACISQLKEHLVHHLGPGALGPFLLLFGLVLWSWMNGSYYHDLHGNEGIRTRFLTLLQMLAAAAVAITLAAALAGQTRGFAVAFTLLQLIITYLWWTTGFYDPDHRTLSRNYLITYSLAAVCLAASAFAPALAWQLWGAALLLNLIPGLISAGVSQREHARRGLVLGPSGAIVERFGLLTMIVLGESILGILNGTAAIAEKTPAVWSAFVIGIVIAFELWWIYFDMLGDRRTRSRYLAMQLLNFLHLPLLAAFVVTGAAIQVLLSA